MSVDGVAAANTMLGFGTCRPGFCLMYVWQAYKAHGARSSQSSPNAYDAWLKSGGKHPGDRNPPPGVPVWFGPKRSSAAGDVVISLGGGRVVATDWPRNGVINITTIDARQRQIGRPYLGWTEDILGADVAFPSAAGGGTGPTPTPSPTPTPKPKRRKRDIMAEAAYTTPDGTIAVQARLGGMVTLMNNPHEWGGIASATGAGAMPISATTLAGLLGTYGALPAGLYDSGALPIKIITPEGGAPDRYGIIGNRAWPIGNVRDLSAMQRQGFPVETWSQADIDKALAWRSF